MNKFNKLNTKIVSLFQESNKRTSVDIAIEIANEIIKILKPSVSDLKNGEDVLDEVISKTDFNNQKTEAWFSEHPYLLSEKLALRHFASNNFESKFYCLSENATNAKISAGVMLFPNWEDSELTRNDNYKIGVDFFLTADRKSVLFVISNSGNLRVLEFNEKLTNTQIEILEQIQGVFNLDTKEQAHKTLWEACALNEVNKRFYQGISEQFNILYAHLCSNGKAPEDSKLFASRLLGRLLFVWFLRKKNIINKEYGYFELIDNDSTKYYDNVLKKLFFKTLNTEKDSPKRSNDNTTPYLNGGLFEPHNNDWAHQLVDFPTGYFNGLYDHLNKFNFTTDESSPEYEQVAIDPEMLGRVFESLLATQVTETGQQARKAKGAFYTPREIVSYMCRESLRQYLYTKLDNEVWNNGVDELLDLSDSKWEYNVGNSKRNLWGEANRKIVPQKVLEVLDEIKIIDPACGSGAFPMGMLQLLIRIYERLENRFDPYKIKLQIIQNNLFGVDIEPMAVEISRLRAWLSVVVSEKNTTNIEPLPNLDFKFVCANSLIPLDKATQIGDFGVLDLDDRLAEIRSKYFNARKPHTKKSWQDKYYKLTNHNQSILNESIRTKQLRSFDPFKNSRAAEFFDANYMLGVDNGFDIVIGNPPYVQLQKNGGELAKLYANYNYQTFAKTGDIYSLFYEKGWQLLRNGGYLAYITSNKWMRAGYGQKTRKFFAEKCNPKVLIDFAGLKVFVSATVDTNILIFSKAKNEHDTQVCVIKDNQVKDLVAYIKQNSTLSSFTTDESWTILSPIEKQIKEKIEKNGTPLKDWDINIYRGILTGYNDAFIINEEKRSKLIDEDPRSAEIIKPLLRGKDIKRYSYEFANLWLINTHNGLKQKGIEPINIHNYPVIKKHLDEFYPKLVKRGDKGITPYNLRNCAYLEDFDKQKILYSEIVQSPQFYLDDKKFVPEATAFMLSGEKLEYLIHFLNSPITAWLFKLYYAGGGLGEKGYRYKKIFLNNLPIPYKFNYSAETLDDTKIIELYGLTEEEATFIKKSL